VRIIIAGLAAVGTVALLMAWERSRFAGLPGGGCNKGCTTYGSGRSQGDWPTGPAYQSTAATNDISTGSAGGDESDSPIRKCPRTMNSQEGVH
jgi:hypothetical protein